MHIACTGWIYRPPPTAHLTAHSTPISYLVVCFPDILNHCCQLPPTAAELPILLSLEAAKGRRLRVSQVPAAGASGMGCMQTCIPTNPIKACVMCFSVHMRGHGGLICCDGLAVLCQCICCHAVILHQLAPIHMAYACQVLAHPDVMVRLQEHRLAELHSTGVNFTCSVVCFLCD